MRRALAATVVALVASLGFSRQAAAHSIPRPYVSLGPILAFEPARRLPLYGGSFAFGLGVDPEKDAILFGGLAVVSPFELSLKVPPADAFAWTSAVFAYRHYYPSLGHGVVPFTTFALGLGATFQGPTVLPSLATMGEAGLRFSPFVSLAITGAYVAPFPAAPVGITLQIGAP